MLQKERWETDATAAVACPPVRQSAERSDVPGILAQLFLHPLRRIEAPSIDSVRIENDQRSIRGIAVKAVAWLIQIRRCRRL
jgi:hypothetical protein